MSLLFYKGNTVMAFFNRNGNDGKETTTKKENKRKQKKPKTYAKSKA